MSWTPVRTVHAASSVTSVWTWEGAGTPTELDTGLCPAFANMAVRWTAASPVGWTLVDNTTGVAVVQQASAADSDDGNAYGLCVSASSLKFVVGGDAGGAMTVFIAMGRCQ